jgi:acetolactate synthase-1/2/3 large subunit
LKLKGAEILVETLIEQGVDTIFGYPGGAVLNIYDALYARQDKIRHILTSHEQGAAHCADGYSRSTGKTGVCLATSGPGATNLVTGIATAFMDSIPMIAITGNVDVNLIGRDSFQEVYIAGITMPITKHNFVVRNVTKLADTVRQAFMIANSDRPGPVLIDIPKDITAALCEYEPQPPVQPIRDIPEVKDETLDMIADLIRKSERPVLYFGGGVILSDAAEIINAFVEKTKIPVCHSAMGTGVISHRNPLDLGMIGMHGTVVSSLAAENCDLLLAVGARFSDRVATKINYFAPHATIVHLDIDAAEINKNVHVDYGIVADAKDIMTRLYDRVEEKHIEPWHAQIREWRETKEYKPVSSDTCIKPHQLMGVINDNIRPDDIITTDVGQHQMWAAQYCTRTNSRTFISSGGLGTMGFGYGAAMGSKVGNPDKTVVHITSDGSFQMNLNEIVTAVTYHIPVITVVLNNQVLGMVRQLQSVFCGKRFIATEVPKKVDYVKMAESFGAKGYSCKTLEEFEKAFREAVSLGCTCVIECIIDKEEFVLPMIPSGGTVQTIITEKP